MYALILFLRKAKRFLVFIVILLSKILLDFSWKSINAYTQSFRSIFLLERITLAKEIMDDFISSCMHMDVHSTTVR